MTGDAAMTIGPRSRQALDLAMLYASKSGAVVVGVFILPLFQGLMGSAAFGVVAVILSLQAFLVAMDLGMSVIVGRDIATSDDVAASLAAWRNAETLLHTAYAVLLPLALTLSALGIPASMSKWQILGCLVMFWALTVQNVGLNALLARRRYVPAGLLQTAGVLLRALVTLLALRHVRADLDVFIGTQALCSIGQLLATRWLCRLEFPNTDARRMRWTRGAEVRLLAVRGRPLMLFGLAGAAVMQLDKVIISSFVSSSALAPYFLASALCLTPISVLGAPIAQLFQPRLIRAIAAGDTPVASTLLQRFVLAIVCAVALPSSILWAYRNEIVGAWIGDQRNAAQVAHYVSILLPGIALGALGHVPYVILLAKQDFRFQARASTAMSVITLIATYAASARGSVEMVCWIYAAYHGLSTVVSWLRCIGLQPPQPHHYATAAALRAVAVLSLIAVLAAALSSLRALAHIYLQGN